MNAILLNWLIISLVSILMLMILLDVVIYSYRKDQQLKKAILEQRKLQKLPTRGLRSKYIYTTERHNEDKKIK